MRSCAEALVSHFNYAFPFIQACWLDMKKRGYVTRLNGERRMPPHARSFHKGMWLAGWDKADKEMKSG